MINNSKIHLFLKSIIIIVENNNNDNNNKRTTAAAHLGYISSSSHNVIVNITMDINQLHHTKRSLCIAECFRILKKKKGEIRPQNIEKVIDIMNMSFRRP